MPRQKNPELWEAMESVLRSVAHLGRASDLEGPDRVERLQDAAREVEEARQLIEHALVQAEYEASDHGGDGEDGS